MALDAARLSQAIRDALVADPNVPVSDPEDATFIAFFDALAAQIVSEITANAEVSVDPGTHDGEVT